MSLESVDIFIKWLDSLESQKRWTDYRLSAETGLSSSVFSKARQGILPKWDALVRIAKAFDVPPETAFRKAGLLPPLPEADEQDGKISHHTQNMTPEQKRAVLAFINSLESGEVQATPDAISAGKLAREKK